MVTLLNAKVALAKFVPVLLMAMPSLSPAATVNLLVGVKVPTPTFVPLSNICELPMVNPSGVHLGTKFNIPLPLTPPTEANVFHVALPAASLLNILFNASPIPVC